MIFYIGRRNRMTERKEIITSLENLNSMFKCLQDNPGVVIIKFGAEWCGPCKKIESLVKQCMQQAPANVQCAIIDVDESLEIYSFLKTKRVINGIPAILGYYKGNLNYIPDDLVIGSDQNQVISFFHRCYKEADK